MALTKVSGSILKDPLNLGEVSIGGTLTYQDVTNVDSVGVITARSGINVTGGDITIPDSIIHLEDTNTKIRFPAADTVTVETAGNEALRVDSSQRLLIGTTSSRTVWGTHSKSQIEGTTGATSSMHIVRNSNDVYYPYLALGKSRGTSAGGNTVIQENDITGVISFNAADGTDMTSQTAYIESAVDDSPGSDDTPGRLSFYTTADGAATGIERFRITSAGAITISGNRDQAPPTAYNDITGTNQAGLLIGSSGITDAGIVLRTGASGTGRIYFADNSGSESARKAGAIEYGHSSNAMLFYTNSTERLRIYSNGAVLIGADSGEAGGDAKLAIDCQGMNIYDGVGDASNYGLIFANDSTTDKANGIGFFNDSASTCGGYIVHQDKGGGNIGDLVFGTSASSDTPVERMRIDKDGNVTRANQPFFSVYGSASNVTYNDGDVVTFENVTHNDGSHFKMTSGTGQYERFIAPVAGIYIFTFGFFPNTASGCRISLAVNGSVQTNPYIGGCFTAWGTGQPAPMAAQMLKLSASDYVDVRITSGTLTNTYDGHTGFQGYLLG